MSVNSTIWVSLGSIWTNWFLFFSSFRVLCSCFCLNILSLLIGCQIVRIYLVVCWVFCISITISEPRVEMQPSFLEKAWFFTILLWSSVYLNWKCAQFSVDLPQWLMNHDVFPVRLIRTATSYACPGVSTGHCWPLLSFGMALSLAVVSLFAYTHWLVFSWILEGGHLQSSLSTCVEFSSPGLSSTHHGCRDGPDSLLSLLNWRSRLQSAYFTASGLGTSLQAESWDDQRSYLICFSSLRGYCLSLPHSSVLQIVYFGREGEPGPCYSIFTRCRHYPSF